MAEFSLSIQEVLGPGERKPFQFSYAIRYKHEVNAMISVPWRFQSLLVGSA